MLHSIQQSLMLQDFLLFLGQQEDLDRHVLPAYTVYNNSVTCNIQITVGWTTTVGTANSNDFRPAADFINIQDGESEGIIPLNIVADGMPEFSEMFMVHLNDVSDGARLGNILSTTVTILPNDDPNGALGIAL